MRTKDGRYEIFFRAGMWVFGVEAEDRIMVNGAVEGFMKHLKNLTANES